MATTPNDSKMPFVEDGIGLQYPGRHNLTEATDSPRVEGKKEAPPPVARKRIQKRPPESDEWHLESAGKPQLTAQEMKDVFNSEYEPAFGDYVRFFGGTGHQWKVTGGPWYHMYKCIFEMYDEILFVEGKLVVPVRDLARGLGYRDDLRKALIQKFPDRPDPESPSHRIDWLDVDFEERTARYGKVYEHAYWAMTDTWAMKSRKVIVKWLLKEGLKTKEEFEERFKSMEDAVDVFYKTRTPKLLAWDMKGNCGNRKKPHGASGGGKEQGTHSQDAAGEEDGL